MKLGYRLTLAARFNEKHDADLLAQNLKILEEAGEVAEAALAAEERLLFKDTDSFDLGDKLAQLIVTAYYATEPHGVGDIESRVENQLCENASRQDARGDRSNE